MNKKDSEYDDIPIVFCRDCLWLGEVNTDATGKEYCPHCGCTSFRSEPAYVWDKLFKEKYNGISFYKYKGSWADIMNNIE